MSKNVKTINGEELPISQCREFQGSYYKIGDINIENSGDCYQIGDKFYRYETGKIVFDHEIQQYTLKNDRIVKGIIGFKDNKAEIGYFSVIGKKNIEVRTPNSMMYGLNSEIFKDTKEYRERLSDGKFYHISTLTAKQFNVLNKPPQEYKTSLPYDSKNVLEQAIENYNNLDIEITNTNIETYGPYLKDYTFGLEFETTKGLIPNRLLEQSGLIPLRDGSISGIEYVTVPLSGTKGLQSIVNDCKLLQERTEFDDSCSLHLHLGGIPRTKEFILALFKTLCFIQDEMFSLFPLYKKYNFGIKNKNYSAPFPAIRLLSQIDSKITDKNIDQNFDILFKYLACGYNSFYDYNCNLDNVHKHPADPEGNQKWQVHSRYVWCNAVPLIFGNKKTIEFRIHTPTFDAERIIPFLFLNVLIVEYVKKNQSSILNQSGVLSNTNLNNIIYSTNIPSPLMDYLSSYVNNRRSHTESSNRASKMMVDELSIPMPYRIKWSSNNKKVKQLSLPPLDSQFTQELKQMMNEFDNKNHYSWINIESTKPIAKKRRGGTHYNVPDEMWKPTINQIIKEESQNKEEGNLPW